MIKRLVGIRLSSLIASAKSKKTGGAKASLSPLKIILFSLLFLYLGGVFVLLFTMMAISFGSMMIPLGQDSMYYGMFMLIGFSVVFVFSIFETKSELFECRDNELLLSMPIKPSDIVVSRIITVLIYNYVEMALIFVPAVVVYAVLGGSAFGIVGGILAYLLLPLLSTSLSAGIGYLLALISKKLKNKTVLTTFISLFFFVAYMVLYTGFVGNMGGELDDSVTVTIPDMPAVSAIGSAATLNPLAAIILVLLSLGSAYAAFKIISDNYISIVTSRVTAVGAEFKKQRLTKRGAIAALTSKELRRFFTSSVYMLNAGIGTVFSVIVAIMALVYSADIKALIEEIPMFSGILAPVFTSALVFMSSMNMISASALSLEGKSLWILKSMPLSGREVLIGKTLPHVIVGAPTMLISSLLVAVAIEASPLDLVFIILIPQVANIVFALFGIIMNTAFPKFEYENEAQPIKQSLAMTVVMFSGMLYGIAISGLSLVLALFISPLISEILVLALNIALALGLFAILVGPSARRYERL